jgi:uncharacterized membrane protein YdbT with pleckstrin-like domain
MLHLNKLPNSLPNETTILFLRRHWVEIFSIFFHAFVMIAILGLFYFTLFLDGFSAFNSPILAPIIAVGTCSYLLFCLIIIISQITDYYLDTWIVTNERVIDIEHRGLFSRTMSELRLGQIQDVTSETHGFLQTFLTYGDVHIQTAAGRARFNFKKIDNPDDVKHKIIALVQEYRRKHPYKAAQDLMMSEAASGGQASPGNGIGLQN